MRTYKLLQCLLPNYIRTIFILVLKFDSDTEVKKTASRKAHILFGVL